MNRRCTPCARLAAALTLACVLACGGPAAAPVEIPRPDLGAAEPAVAEQLAAAADRLAGLRARGGSEAERAAAWGELGRLYQAYDFSLPAAACYREAARLAPKDPRWPYYRGVLAQVEGDWETAAQMLERTLEIRPGDRPGLLRLAAVRLELGDLEAAEDLYRRGAADRLSAASAEGLGRIALRRGDPAAAIAHFESAVEAQPEAGVLHYQLARAYRAAGRSREADEALARSGPGAVGFEDPLMAELERLAVGTARRMARAGAALSAGRVETAVAEYRRAVAADPDDFPARLDLGVLLALTGESAEAETHLRAAVRLAPDNPSARQALGRLLTAEGRFDEARAELARALELDPGSEAAAFGLGSLEAAAGDHGAAVAVFDRLLEGNPQAAAARRARALSNLELERAAAAVADLEALVAADPEDAAVRLHLGEALQRAGDSTGALEQYRRAAAGGLPARQRALAWLGVGNLSLAAGDPAAARRAFVAALEAAPGLAPAHFNLAGLEAGAGDLDAARRHYRRAVELEPGDPAARFHLGLTLLRLGLAAEAEGHFAEALRGDPGHEGATAGRASALYELGRFGDSAEVLEAGLARAPESRTLAHALARLLASCPDRSRRDGKRAVEISLRLVEAAKELQYAETLAMALAESGRFTDAVRWQREVIRQATGAWPPAHLDLLRANLERYEAGEPCCADS